MSENLSIKKVAIIAKLNDGSYHQVIIGSSEMDDIINAIGNICGNPITLLEDDLPLIEF